MLSAKILNILILTRRAISRRGVRKTCTLNIMSDYIVKGVDCVRRGLSFRLDAPGDGTSGAVDGRAHAGKRRRAFNLRPRKKTVKKRSAHRPICLRRTVSCCFIL